MQASTQKRKISVERNAMENVVKRFTWYLLSHCKKDTSVQTAEVPARW